MNKILGILIALLIIGGGAYYLTRTPGTTTYVAPDDVAENPNATGRVVFSVTDAAANMSTISEINMKVSRVELFDNAKGWVTITTTPHTYSLLALNASGQSQILADMKTKVGSYDRVRLMVDEVSVVTKAGATSRAAMPSHELDIDTTLIVKPEKTASVNFDFLADKSLLTASNNAYVFAPVVKTESRSDTTVTIDTNNVITITGGTVDNSGTMGMDLDGSLKLNFVLTGSQKIDLDANNVIKLDKVVNAELNGTLNTNGN